MFRSFIKIYKILEKMQPLNLFFVIPELFSTPMKIRTEMDFSYTGSLSAEGYSPQQWVSSVPLATQLGMDLA